MRYKILYTHQKLKKKKTWQDGYLDVDGKKARVLSEELKELDSLFIKPNEICDDAELESDRYLINVECSLEGANNASHPGKENTSVPRSAPQPLKPFAPFKRHGIKNSTMKPPNYTNKPFEPLHPSLSMQSWSGDPRNTPLNSVHQRPPTSIYTRVPPATASFPPKTVQPTYTPRFSNMRPPPRHGISVQSRASNLPQQSKAFGVGSSTIVRKNNKEIGRRIVSESNTSARGINSVQSDTLGGGCYLKSVASGDKCKRSTDEILSLFDGDDDFQDDDFDCLNAYDMPECGSITRGFSPHNQISTLNDDQILDLNDKPRTSPPDVMQNLDSVSVSTHHQYFESADLKEKKFNEEQISTNELLKSTKNDPFFPYKNNNELKPSSFSFHCFPSSDEEDEVADDLFFPANEKKKVKTDHETFENKQSMNFLKDRNDYFGNKDSDKGNASVSNDDKKKITNQGPKDADYLLSLFTQSNFSHKEENDLDRDIEASVMPRHPVERDYNRKSAVIPQNQSTILEDFETKGISNQGTDDIMVDDDFYGTNDDFISGVDDFLDGDFKMSEDEEIFEVSGKKKQVITIDDDKIKRSSGTNRSTLMSKKRTVIYPESSKANQPSHPNPPPTKKQFTVRTNTHVRGGFSAPARSYGHVLYKFPEKDDVTQKPTPKRVIPIPIEFESATSYKLTFKSVLNEHINIILFELAGKYHNAIGKADVTAIQYGSASATSSMSQQNNTPTCSHGPSRMNAVRKEGKNKGRLFYTCANIGAQKCNFFKWADEVKRDSSIADGSINSNQAKNKVVLNDYHSASAYFNSHGIQFYHNVKFLLKVPFKKFFKGKKSGGMDTNNSKKVMYISLPNKKASSFYNKDDIWIISKTLDFPLGSTFIAKSVFYGPKSSGELEIAPLCSYSSPNWQNNELCYAIQAFNASTELTCLDNLENFVNVLDVPVLPSLLSQSSISSRSHVASTRFNLSSLPRTEVLDLVVNTATSFSLNDDQREALTNIGRMFVSDENNHVTLIHGVFGAGKSYLLSVVVLFLVKLFEVIETQFGLDGIKLKLMISSITNVAVDRVLAMLLEHEFEEFIRIGSVKKIAKRILPHSVHACDKDDQELQELNELMATEITEEERGYVRKAIELHKLGVNRNKLSHVRVVGVTCAACVFPFLQRNEFHVQLQDECSQMMEPISLLPVARFKCQRLILVGDPKQLSPTIQGSESEQDVNSLEMTLFERLEQLGYQTSMLRTQYRCHPSISAICNEMFYGGQLKDGITADQREPIFDWLPTLSVVDCDDGREENGSDGSYYNLKEAEITVQLLSKILQSDLDIDPNQVGVITQYKAQVWKINTLLRNSNPAMTSANNTAMKSIQISTVDAFQGAEKDIIILSCVRTRHVGFIDCRRRTNVALSRAKKHLVIVGKVKLLQSNACWGGVLNVCRAQNASFSRSNVFIKKLCS